MITPFLSTIIPVTVTFPRSPDAISEYVIVAAANSPTHWKEAATYQCDGTEDDVEWQAAAVESRTPTLFTSAVLVAPGTYNFRPKTSLSGMYIGAGIRGTVRVNGLLGPGAFQPTGNSVYAAGLVLNGYYSNIWFDMGGVADPDVDRHVFAYNASLFDCQIDSGASVDIGVTFVSTEFSKNFLSNFDSFNFGSVDVAMEIVGDVYANNVYLDVAFAAPLVVGATTATAFSSIGTVAVLSNFTLFQSTGAPYNGVGAAVHITSQDTTVDTALSNFIIYGPSNGGGFVDGVFAVYEGPSSQDIRVNIDLASVRFSPKFGSSDTTPKMIYNPDQKQVSSTRIFTAPSGERPAASPMNLDMLFYNTTTGTLQRSDGTAWSDITSGAGGSPLTTKGDLYTYTTGNARLPVGSDSQILIVNPATASGLEWVDIESICPECNASPASPAGCLCFEPGGARRQIVAVQTISNASSTEIDFDSSIFDEVSAFLSWNATNDEYDVDRSCLVSVHVGIAWEANATGARTVQIRINGTVRAASVSNANDNGSLSTVQNLSLGPYPVSVSDTISVTVEQDSGGDLDVVNSTDTFIAATVLRDDG